MGISTYLLDEAGRSCAEPIHDAQKLLNRLLPAHDDTSFQCLRFVDPYGNTTFNRAQMDELLAELDRVEAKAKYDYEKDLVRQIRQLALRCKNEVHLYLKFVGD